MNNEKDPLARWWWPGQWLHIVYGVWIDQLWYWQNVRPRLRGRTQGWKLFVQGMFGTMLIALGLLAVLGGTLEIAGVQVNWRLLTLGVIGGVVGSAAAGVVVGTVRGLASGVTLGVGLGIFAAFILIILLRMIEDVAAGVVLGVISGMVLGVGKGVNEGTRQSVLKWAAIAAFIGIIIGALCKNNGIAAGIAGGVTCGIALYLCERWTTRQVPDAETRKRLANPDMHSNLDRSLP